MKLQLVGPMTGLPQFNHPAFMAAAKLLRSQGHEVFNPAEVSGGDTTLPRSHYMRASVGGLLHAEGIVVLPDWETRQGACLEVGIARELKLKIFPLAHFMTEPKDPGPVVLPVPDGPSD